MAGCTPKQKRSTVEAILNCLSLCSHTGVCQDKSFGQVDCKKCYYTCKEDNKLEVRCKQCQTESQQKSLVKCSDICSKCKRRKLVCSIGKCCKKKCKSPEIEVKGMLCKKCKKVCEDGQAKLVCKQCKEPIKTQQEDKNVATENAPPNYKELNPKMLSKLDCKICGFETQADGTKDFVCNPCIDKARKKLCETSKECESSVGKKTLTENLYPCQQCGVKVKKERCHNVLRLVCDHCAGKGGPPTSDTDTTPSGPPTSGGKLNISNLQPYSVDISWDKPEKEPEKYLVQVQENAPDGEWKTVQTLPGDLDPTQTTVTGLSPNVPYAFQVIPVTKDGESPPITSDIVTTPSGDDHGGTTSGGPPTSGGKLQVSNLQPHSVDLSWDKPEKEPEKYLVQMQENAPDGEWKTVQTLPGDLDPTQTTVTGLSPNVPYAFRVIPVTKDGESPPFTSDIITTPSGDDHGGTKSGDDHGGTTSGEGLHAPEGPLTGSDITPISVALNWKHPSTGEPPKSYKIEKQVQPDGQWQPADTVPYDGGSAPKAVVNDLEPDTPYHFRVMGVNEKGESPPLQTEEPIRTLPLQDPQHSPPHKPEHLEVKDINPNGLTLAWDKPKKGPNPDAYHVDMQELPDGPWTNVAEVPGSETSKVIDGLHEGDYKFRVAAGNKVGKSPPVESDNVNIPAKEPSDLELYSAGGPRTWSQSVIEPKKSTGRKSKKVRAKSRPGSRGKSRPGSRGRSHARGGRTTTPRKTKPRQAPAEPEEGGPST